MRGGEDWGAAGRRSGGNTPFSEWRCAAGRTGARQGGRAVLAAGYSKGSPGGGPGPCAGPVRVSTSIASTESSSISGGLFLIRIMDSVYRRALIMTHTLYPIRLATKYSTRGPCLTVLVRGRDSLNSVGGNVIPAAGGAGAGAGGGRGRRQGA